LTGTNYKKQMTLTYGKGRNEEQGFLA